MMVPEVCPRCKYNWIPNNDSPGAYPGAISRADNKTEICSACGTDEALMQHFEGRIIPVEDWGIDPVYSNDEPVKEWADDSLQNIDGGGKPVEELVAEEDDVLCRFIDKESNRTITVITAPHSALNEDGPVVTQIADNQVVVVFADEYISRKVETSYEKNKEEFGDMAMGIGLAFVMRAAMEAAIKKFDESI